MKQVKVQSGGTELLVYNGKNTFGIAGGAVRIRDWPGSLGTHIVKLSAAQCFRLAEAFKELGRELDKEEAARRK